MTTTETDQHPPAQWYDGPGAVTPWGRADAKWVYAKGVTFYSTPGHGGFKVNKAQNAQIPEPFRNADGWYEEDDESHIPFYFLLRRTASADSLRHQYPHQWMAVTGEALTPEQSSVLRREAFEREHADDWVTTSAYGSWANWVPQRMVGVHATRGGKSGHYEGDTFIRAEETRWLVPRDEYDAREGKFVIDPARHFQFEKVKP